MRIHAAVEQGTEEWFALRRGKFTASIASKMVTPTGRPSAQYRGEIGRIIAETMGWQDPEPLFQTPWMVRGTELEEEARRWFTVETGLPITQVGFVESKSGLTGFSPDGIIEAADMFTDRGGMLHGIAPLELKVPKPSTHIGWLLEGGLPKEHRAQVHFALCITGAPHGWFMSYSEKCEPLIVKVEADDYTETMSKAIDKYADEFRAAFLKIVGIDYNSLIGVQE